MSVNVLRTMISRGAGLLLAAVFFVALTASGTAHGKIPGVMPAKVTFTNKTDRNVFVALCWCTGDTMKKSPDGGTIIEGERWLKGWFKVEPGKSRTITLSNVLYDANDFGFYAESSAPKGQKKYIWQGGKGNALGVKTYVHPTNSFNTNRCDVMEGGKLVIFRTMALKEKNGNWVGSVTLSTGKK